MAGAQGKQFTHDHVVEADGSVTFACSQDTQTWPWTAIGPHHPGAIQAASYWLSVESAMALGGWDPDKWSALTWTRWACGEPGVGRMAHGRYERVRIDGKESFSIHLYDAQDALVCRLDGRGVVFRTRDFEKWRSQAKEASAKVASAGFGYADPEVLGLDESEFAFLGPLDGARAIGLLDADNAMPPAHPWLDGSGDHVNSAHLAEVARQFTSLLRGGAPFRVTKAEMRFDRYVELGVPFEVERVGGTENRVTMQLRQSGRACTWIDYGLEAL
ncbi:hypothetical protein [Qipengyuania sp.]|uniref:hypothetical protein n=1 Tax=Qipengyuania sp. TaxID=2004515 RepID=UPI0035129612